MTDWTKTTGSYGVMMIRDTGTTVEFWLKANSYTYNHQLPWKYTINGKTSGWLYFDFIATNNWQKLGSWSVTYDQTVTFYLGSTGTMGLGGPTTFSHILDRGGVPLAPTIIVNSVTNNSINVTARNNGSNGSPVDRIQVGYGIISSGPVSFLDLSLTNPSGNITGLTQNTLYYLWVRMHNSTGWSAWSNRTQAPTQGIPAKTTKVVVTARSSSSVDVRFGINDSGGSPITAAQVGYATSSGGPYTYVSATTSSPQALVSGLKPGVIYYFVARAANKYGWSPDSDFVTAMTIAAARIRTVNGWKIAIPYVNHGGVWKVAETYVRKTGQWIKTQ